MGCCHDKDNFQEIDIQIESTEKVKLSSSNQLTATREIEPFPPHHQSQETSIMAEEGLRQSPILGPTAPDFWQGLEQEGEEMEGDILRATHSNNRPINMENIKQKRMENAVPAALPYQQIRYTCPNPTFVAQQRSVSEPYSTPKITFGPLATINEEESSLNDTNRKSVNQMSVSDYSQRAEVREIRRMF